MYGEYQSQLLAQNTMQNDLPGGVAPQRHELTKQRYREKKAERLEMEKDARRWRVLQALAPLKKSARGITARLGKIAVRTGANAVSR
ncbi:hypothetical protein SAMN05444000_10485 [Shimia gijangensis]|uniref:Uncharacterized protein n=1 Tax=Shimia gijangensis TaxID=1470563 RepID=A0A1M6FIS5_9RHOB|nr:hypothetical protein [Shimia gijangensis]SHI97564.1 hypothetical protein SAMN05444000_10485 [Shimia gijangensis]